MGDYVNEEHVMTIGDVLSVTGGSTKVKIIAWDDDRQDCLWSGLVDDYDFDYCPYGHQLVRLISVINKDFSGDRFSGDDTLYICMDYPEITTEAKKEIKEIERYMNDLFCFWDFPENIVKQIYLKYGKNTKRYLEYHSMVEILTTEFQD